MPLSKWRRLCWLLPLLALAGCLNETATPTPVLPDLSPSPVTTPHPLPGGRIAFVRATGGQVAGTLWVVRPDGTGLTPLPTSYPVDSIPVWSPDGTRLAYQAQQNGKDQIYVVTVQPDNTAGQTVLLTATAQDQDNTLPAWSPDGTQIVYQSGGATAQIQVMNAAGAGRPRPVAGVPPYAGQPAWAHDSQHFAFSGGASATVGREIYTIPITGGIPLRLTASEGTAVLPRWAPDGSALAFMLRPAGSQSNDIYRIAADGSGQQALADDPKEDNWPVWSPDGQWVAFFSARSGSNDVFVVPAAGGVAVNVSNHAAEDDYPTWAADSYHLVFSSKRSGRYRLYLAGRDGADLRLLTSADGDYDEYFPAATR